MTSQFILSGERRRICHSMGASLVCWWEAKPIGLQKVSCRAEQQDQTQPLAWLLAMNNSDFRD
ncbi:MAG: hypothetical protein OSA47_04470, partial [Novosphingopyxis baekryungensis]|nr:hypothetical protein [Novosphingopyxis baekryungensis]